MFGLRVQNISNPNIDRMFGVNLNVYRIVAPVYLTPVKAKIICLSEPF